ncbi:MAG: helix-turn-helix transcriptional regulator [Bryobacteraceae bacterium]|nr:helix-turn-helix transcriptional regulator [Bryobacteraceae bacterium]
MHSESIRNQFWFRPDFQLGVQTFRWAEPISFPLHSHPEYSIVFCTRGAVQVQQLGCSETVTAGEVIVGNAHVPHVSEYGTSGEECAGVTITLDSEAMIEWLNEFGMSLHAARQRLVLMGKIEAPDLMPIVVRLLSEAEERKPGYRLVLEGLARQLTAETFRRWPRELISGKQAPRLSRQLPRHQLVKAVEYMNQCGKDEFRMPDLCETVGSSLSRFTQLFFESTQSKPLPFFNRVVIERAKRQLANSDRSVKDVAYGLGFRSVSHFCTLFKSVTGLPPLVYTHNCRGVIESGPRR